MCNEYMLNKAYSSPVVAWGALVNAINQFNGVFISLFYFIFNIILILIIILIF